MDAVAIMCHQQKPMSFISLEKVTNTSEVGDVFICKLTMSAVNLLVEVAGVDEKYSFVFTSCFIEEPKSRGESDGEEHITRQ